MLVRLAADALGVVYSLGLALLIVHGARVLFVTLLYVRVRHRAEPRGTPGEPPHVTIQVPLYNERTVARRAIDAACRVRWPHDRLEIQVLDDSTDETRSMVDERAAWWAERGVAVRVMRRPDRDGYKAGALARGLEEAAGDVLAILDADFVPEQDFLERTVPYLGPGVAAVQARWGHLNADASGLTRVQALALDGYFLVDQTARSRAGHFVVFNGSGGIWRREALVSAGGWCTDTISEDVDLSYRAQLRGWRIVVLPDVVVPAELPASLGAYRRQQHRWACGTTQVLRKAGRAVVTSGRSPWVRFVALLTLAAHLAQPVSLGLFLLAPLVMVVRPGLHGVVGLVAVAAVSPPLMCAVAAAELHRDWPRRLLSYPLLAAVAAGLTLNGTLAVARALRGRPTPFERTPKSGSNGASGRNGHVPAAGATALAEAALAAYGWAGLLVALQLRSVGFALFFALFAVGFTLTTALTAPRRARLRVRSRRPRAPVGER